MVIKVVLFFAHLILSIASYNLISSCLVLMASVSRYPCSPALDTHYTARQHTSLHSFQFVFSKHATSKHATSKHATSKHATSKHATRFIILHQTDWIEQEILQSTSKVYVLSHMMDSAMRR